MTDAKLIGFGVLLLAVLFVWWRLHSTLGPKPTNEVSLNGDNKMWALDDQAEPIHWLVIYRSRLQERIGISSPANLVRIIEEETNFVRKPQNLGCEMRITDNAYNTIADTVRIRSASQMLLEMKAGLGRDLSYVEYHTLGKTFLFLSRVTND